MAHGSVETLPQEEVEKKTELGPLYQVILFDDDEHSYPYVIEMLGNIFGIEPQEANRIAYEVDFLGEAVVVRCPYEEAVEGCQRITSYGPDPRLENSRGSMNATVQPDGA
jgi:ATP-dependent Clp protease adaptor protein ClpS